MDRTGAHLNEMAEGRRIYGQATDLVLNTCFSNTPNLSSSYRVQQCSQGSGYQNHANLSEYVARLVEQAQVLTANTSSRNPRVTRSVNVSELQFDDNEPNPNAYETHA
jgi:hypothetical protein